MRPTTPPTAELHELLWQFRAGTATSDQLTRLERMVCDDPRARSFYVRYMHMCADLCSMVSAADQAAVWDDVQGDPRCRAETERKKERNTRRSRANRTDGKPSSPSGAIPFAPPMIVKESTCLS
jgi:hypothetical protein